MPKTESGVTGQQHASIKPAGRRRRCAADRQGSHLPGPAVQPRRFRCQLVLPDGEQGQAKAGVLDRYADQRSDQHQPQCNQRVETRIGELQERHRVLPLQRQGNLLQPGVLQDVEEQDRVGQHRQREIMPAQAQGWQADQECGDRSHASPERNADPRG